MYNVIKLTEPSTESPDKFMEQFEVDTTFTEGNITGNSTDMMEEEPGLNFDSLYTEAVFADGKKTVEPILKGLEKVREILLQEIKKVDETTKEHKGNKSVEVYKFNPEKYWKNPAWKELEDSIMKVFGFRYCEVNPYIEKYIHSANDFESRELNCCVYHPDRFPIEGLVTDKGYYDHSHSSTMMIYITLGLIRDLEPAEILAVLLHEFGHSIDPALTTITYTEVNVLSKYLTDRTGQLTDTEKKAMKRSKNKLSGDAIIVIIYIALLGLPLIIGGLKALFSWIREKIKGKDAIEQEKLDKIRDAIRREKDEFNRQQFSEAFADNFARMYGYGAALMKGLNKCSKHIEKQINEASWLKKERRRRDFITAMTLDALKDVHKTDIHRIRSLIKEYKADINDPKTPPTVKKYLEQDLKELEEVLDMYLNNFSDFQNKVNKTINDALIYNEEKREKKENK